MKKLSFHRSIIAWFVLAFSILFFVGYSSYISFDKLNAEKAWVDHTYKVIDNLKEVLADVKDTQSAQRGYVLTGEKNYLSPYSLAIPDLVDRFATLDRLTSDNPVQAARLKRVKDETDKRLATTANIISTYDEKGDKAATALIREGTGARETAIIRTLIEQMVQEETRLLDQRQYNVGQTTRATLRTGTSGLIFCTLILILVFWTIHKESSKREKIEVSLQSALQDMEHATMQTTQIGKLSDYMQSCQTTDEAYRVISNSMPQLMPEAAGAVAIFRNSRNLVESIARWGDAGQTMPKDFNPDQCWGLRRGRAHYFVPGGTEPCCSHFLEEPKGASLCLPMQAQGETLGLFSVVIDHISKTSKEKVAFARRVSEQISLALANLNLQNKLREQSIRDPLTKVFNRRYLELTLERELKRAERKHEPISVLVLDIDHFKRFNDTMGHDAGDSLLAQFAALLENNVRKEDIVCRYGGEEFVIVLPMANMQMAVERANKICEATRKLKINSLDKTITSVSVSIGVSAYPQHGKEGHSLITAADTALYASKHSGRDRVTAAPFAEEV